ncbi:DnaJ-domain-containing protein [Karstenula rhodostoma CBS 690.94]|uniref:DnaJ-domain-containing protein n=1 Tax=Karstenula rhodostoma CBS 690.94 TaxID=1392251 RepID=A0A9P4UA01_9PLEO|nr:DnaJ-domain-containing protein [Karstenula rhodostoma CBS 690.94]
MEPTKPDFPNYYLDLGLTQTATLTEIKTTFRKLALLYHPDKKGLEYVHDDADFKRISAAYEVLSDAAERADYDAQYPAWIKYWEDVVAEERRSQGDTNQTQGGEEENEDQDEYYDAEEENEDQYEYYDAEIELLWERQNAIQSREDMMLWEHAIHNDSMEISGATVNRWGGCDCNGCGSRYSRQQQEKINPPPKRLTDYEFALLRAYQNAKRRHEREKEREASRREAAEKEKRATEAAERLKREAERKAAEETRRAAQEATEKRRREEAERYRKEQEKKAAAAKRKRDAEERTRKARERSAKNRSEEVARRAREEQEKTARLRMANAFIQGKHDECLAEFQAGGSAPKPAEVEKCIGWFKKKGVTNCLFCGADINHFSFQLPGGGAVACNPCKKGFNNITVPSEEVGGDGEQATVDDV